jgi:uncharacterized protein (DUF433 family)
MVPDDHLARIAVDPAQMGGQPFIRGTSLTVDYICRRISQGATAAELMREHEGLSKGDILACLWFPTPSFPGGPVQPAAFDLKHRYEVDSTLIRQCLAMTPTERLRCHEGWRLFAKEALRNAAKRRGNIE